MFNVVIMLPTVSYCGLLLPYGNTDLGNIASGNGLLPESTEPLLEPMLTYH